MATTPRDTSTGPLIGTIERITFHNADNGFTVLQVRVGGGDVVSVVGHLIEPREGEAIEAAGQWVFDRRHGQQFQAERLRSQPPSSREAVVKYLSSGFIKGVGPHMASLLVEKFGDALFDVLDNRPKELLKVRGLGRKRYAQITESWREQRAVREVMIFLQEHGIGSERALRIYKRYGEKTVTMLRANPYRLATDIDGIGFATADAIAEKLGIARDSPLRARAGVLYVLGRLTTDGHCAYPEAELAAKSAELLELDESLAREAIDARVAEARLIREAIDGEPWVYLTALHDAEVGVAHALQQLMAGPPPLADLKVTAALDWVEKKANLALSASQREAVESAFRNKVLVITGGPGVGKTTVLNCILMIACAKEMKCVLCAPTGRAAKRVSQTTGMEAKTIHRLLEFDPRTGRFMRDAENLLEGDLFVVDETSMIDVPVAHALLQAIPPSASLLLVGDADQLPSVGPGRVLGDIIESGRVPSVCLTEIFRQAEASRIITAAHEINHGVVPDVTSSDADSDFFFTRADDAAVVQERIVSLVRDRIPRRFELDPVADIQVLTPMNRGPLGTEELNRILQEALNPPAPGKPSIQRGGRTFRVGDRVMQIENNYEKEVFNGDVGTVIEIDTAEVKIMVRFDARLVAYDKTDMSQLTTAYAVTIHKSQGSEYPAVVVPIHTQHYRMLQRNLIYTAVTRARRLVVLAGMPKALAIAVDRADAGRRCTALAKRLRNSDDVQ